MLKVLSILGEMVAFLAKATIMLVAVCISICIFLVIALSMWVVLSCVWFVFLYFGISKGDSYFWFIVASFIRMFEIIRSFFQEHTPENYKSDNFLQL